MSQAMTYMEQVARVVLERGRANVEQVLGECPGLTRQQVLKALNHAKYRGYVHSIGLETVLRPDGLREVAAFAAGQFPPNKDEGADSDARSGWRFGRVASVWDLGQGVTV